MRVDVGVKEFEEQRVQIWMDEARLRYQFVRRRLVERDRVRAEVFEDLCSQARSVNAVIICRR